MTAPVRCPGCGEESAGGAKFCPQCGTRLPSACAACGAGLPAGARFCPDCGHRVTPAGPEARPAEPPPAPRPSRTGGPGASAGYTPRHLADKILRSRSALEGERRQVTVLFADLAGFTSLAEKLDPEDTHRIVDRCFELITAEVHRFDGTINQYTGDGVMALFGAPIAHEDAARRAVHAALGIQRAMRDFSRDLQAERSLAVQMRVGINTGPVVVGKIGDDLRMDYTAVGDTTNLAARMQQAARPGSILVAEATHRAIAGYFETLDLGELTVKGHAPVRAFEVLRPRGRRSRLDVAAERGLTPLVGRERELRALRDVFEQVKVGRGQVVLVMGDAGIGKSRLLLEFRRLLGAAGEEATWLEGQCVSFGQAVPFLPLVDQLRRNFGIEELDGEPEIIAKVEHGMRRMGGLEAHIPFVRHLLSVDPGDPAVLAMAPPARRDRVHEAARALSVRGAQIRTLVLLIEDLHWVDASTEEYLSWLIDSLGGYRVMLILTHRPGYTPPFRSRSYQMVLTLQTLSEPEVGALAARVLGVPELPADVLRVILDKAEGVPLFIEEVAKTLVDLGVLRRDNGHFRVVEGASGARVPDTIQGIIMARLDRLGDEGKRTVQLASVIGRRFLVRLLERIVEFTGQLDGLLQELRQLEIIYELALLPEPAYVFKHAVIQDVAYQSLLVQRRRELHQRVGHAIEELYADRLADHYEELAHHYLLGEAWGKAFEYLVRSADRAKHAYANQTALDAYARALEIAPRIAPAVSPASISQIHQRRHQVWLLLSRYPDAIAEAEKMLEVARAAGLKRGEGEALADLANAHFLSFSSEHLVHARRRAEEALAIARDLHDQRLIARSLGQLGLVDQAEGDPAAGDRKMEESLRLGLAGGFKDVVVPARVWMGAHANWRGDFHVSIPMCREAAETAVEAHDGLNEILSLAFLCLGHIGLGEHAEALAVLNEGMAKAKERNNTFILGRLTNSLGWLHQELGDFPRAIECDREAVEMGRASKNANVEVSSLINLGYDQLHLGDADQALTLLEETQVRVDKFGFGAHRWRWSMHLHTHVAEALLTRGDHARARAAAERGIAQARATGSRKYVGRGLYLRGLSAVAAGEAAAAAPDLEEALRIARQIGYPTLTWQAAHALAGALAAGAQGGRAPARAVERAQALARLALDTVMAVADRLPYPALAQSFLAWRRVESVREDVDRIGRL